MRDLPRSGPVATSQGWNDAFSHECECRNVKTKKGLEWRLGAARVIVRIWRDNNNDDGPPTPTPAMPNSSDMYGRALFGGAGDLPDSRFE